MTPSWVMVPTGVAILVGLRQSGQTHVEDLDSPVLLVQAIGDAERVRVLS